MTTLRQFFLPLLFGFSIHLLYAQDPAANAAQQAAQQAMQQAQQANQDAMRSAQEANDRAMQASQQAQQDAQVNAQNTSPALEYTLAPSFSVKAGPVRAGTVVRLKTRTHYATIYFTTNGWSPTVNSTRYTGPITVSETTVVQAIAIAPNLRPSLISSAKFIVQSTPKPIEALVLSDGVLRAGTVLRVATDAAVSSKTAQVGDPLNLVLAQDVKVGDRVVLPKGTPIEATITQADPSGHVGTPGDVAFEVHNLKFGDRTIALQGGETLEGENHYHRALGLAVIPVVGIAGLAAHGEEAEIKPGMMLTAAVAADTPLEQ